MRSSQKINLTLSVLQTKLTLPEELTILILPTELTKSAISDANVTKEANATNGANGTKAASDADLLKMMNRNRSIMFF